MKLRHILAIILVLLALAVTLVFLSGYGRSRPVLHTENPNRIEFIRYNPDFGAQGSGTMLLLEGAAQEDLIRYLASCTEKNVGGTSGSYFLDDVAIEILVSTGEEIKHILLGNINQSSAGSSSQIYKIQHGGEVFSHVSDILALQWKPPT